MPTYKNAAKNSGRLDQRVALELAVPISDNAGGQQITWQPVQTLHAAVEPVREQSTIQAGGRQAVNRYAVTVRQGLNITLNHRFVWQGKTLQILTIEERGARALLQEILVQEAEQL